MKNSTDKNQVSKSKAVEAALLQIEKQFGKGSVMKLGQKQAAVQVPVIPTGSISFDLGLGIGGFPRGRVVEIFGPEATGKTTLALHVIAEAQKRGGLAAFIDAEHALDPHYAARIGVDIDNLLVSQPDYGEQALEIAEVLVRGRPCSESGVGGRDGGYPRWSSSPPHVAGSSQANLHCQPLQDLFYLY